MAAPGVFGFQGQLGLNNQQFMQAISQAQQRLAGFASFAKGIGNSVTFGGQNASNLGTFNAQLGQANQLTNNLNRSLSGMSRTMTSGLGIGIAVGGLALLERGFSKAIEKARQFQTITLSIAAAMQSSKIIVNREDPGNVSYFSGPKLGGKNDARTIDSLRLGFKKSLGEATVLNKELLSRSAKNILTYEEQSQAFLVGTPIASRKGLTQKQQLDLTENLAIAAKVLGQKGQQISNQVRVVLSGQNIPRSVLGSNLGLGNEIKSMHGDKFYNYVMDRVKGFQGGAPQFENSIEGLLAQIETKIDVFAAKVGAKFTKAFTIKGKDGSSLSSKISDFFDSDQADSAAQSLAEIFKNVLSALTAVANSPATRVLRNFLEFLARFGDELLILGALRQLQRLLVQVAASAGAAGASLQRLYSSSMNKAGLVAPGVPIGAASPIGAARGARLPGQAVQPQGFMARTKNFLSFGAPIGTTTTVGAGAIAAMQGTPMMSMAQAQQMAMQQQGFSSFMTKGGLRYRGPNGQLVSAQNIPALQNPMFAQSIFNSANAQLRGAMATGMINGVPVGAQSNLGMFHPARTLVTQQAPPQVPYAPGTGAISNVPGAVNWGITRFAKAAGNSIQDTVNANGGLGNTMSMGAMRGSMAYMGWTLADQLTEKAKARVKDNADGSFSLDKGSGLRTGMNMLGGAVTGAAVGSAFGPIGTAVGATVGALGGLVAAVNEAKQANEDYANRIKGIGDDIAAKYLTDDSEELLKKKAMSISGTASEKSNLETEAVLSGYKNFNEMFKDKSTRIEKAGRAKYENRVAEEDEKIAKQQSDESRTRARFTGMGMGPTAFMAQMRDSMMSEIQDAAANKSKLHATQGEVNRAGNIVKWQDSLPASSRANMPDKNADEIARDLALYRVQDQIRARSANEANTKEYGTFSDLAGAAGKKFTAGLFQTLAKAGSLRDALPQDQLPGQGANQNKFLNFRNDMLQRYVDDFGLELRESGRSVQKMKRSLTDLADSSSNTARDITRLGEDQKRVKEDFHVNMVKAGLNIEKSELGVAEAQNKLAESMRAKAQAADDIKLFPYQNNDQFKAPLDEGMKSGRNRFQDEIMKQQDDQYAKVKQGYDDRQKAMWMGAPSDPNQPSPFEKPPPKPGSFDFFDKIGYEQAKREFGGVNDASSNANLNVLNARIGVRESQINQKEAKDQPDRLQTDFSRTLEDMATKTKDLTKTLDDNVMAAASLRDNLMHSAAEYARMAADFQSGQKIFSQAISAFELKPVDVKAQVNVDALAQVVVEGISPATLAKAISDALNAKLPGAVEDGLNKKSRDTSRTLK